MVEMYAAKGSELDRLVREASEAESEMRRAGVDVRYVRTILVPDDEICFHLFDGSSLEAIRQARRRTPLEGGRGVAAVTWERLTPD